MCPCLALVWSARYKMLMLWDFALTERIEIFAIVNVTADSFSDGGRYLDPGRAVEHALKLIDEGADVIDLGPASSHPDAAKITPEEEILRVDPILDRLLAANVRVSVDSFQRDTQRHAIARGVEYLNDIQGFPNPSFYPEIADSNVSLVVMHSVQRHGNATRVVTDPSSIVDEIERFFDDRLHLLESAGIARERIVLDPGMGFFLGSTPAPSIAVLGSLQRLKKRYRLPLLVSVSRKSFLKAITGRETEELGPATLAAELFAVEAGASHVRTHDPGALRDALAVRAALDG